MQRQLVRIVFLLLICSLTMPGFGQAPQQFNYQAVLRDEHGQPMANKTVSLRLRIRNGGPNGAAQYTEVRTVTTNQFGLVTVAVNGPGADAQQGSIGLVDWANGTKFLQVEVDHDKDGTFTDMGATQILSTPYAMYARPQGEAGGDLGGSKYPNPTINKIQGKAVDLSGSLYHGYTLKWDQVNNKWIPGKDEDGGPDFYFKATRNHNEDVHFASINNVDFFWPLLSEAGTNWTYPYTNLLRFPSEEADPYGLFKDSVFTAPVDGYYEFEVFLWFPRFLQSTTNPPVGFIMLGIEKNDTTKLTFTIDRYDNVNEADSKPARLRRTVNLQAGDKLKFKMAAGRTQNSLQPVVLGHTPAVVHPNANQYWHINKECLTVSGRKLR